tara:strand:- start:45 stop:479 length:435 start_codon:yes stop_codon:yes gene_type:complete
MEYFAIAISAIALGLSFFNFYWANLRKTKHLYLIRIDRWDLTMNPRIGLLNASSDDILIADIKCAFRGSNKSIGTYPAQTLMVDESKSLLVPSGKFIQCTIQISAPLDREFLMEGERDEMGETALYNHALYIHVSWIEGNGDTR